MKALHAAVNAWVQYTINVPSCPFVFPAAVLPVAAEEAAPGRPVEPVAAEALAPGQPVEPEEAE